MIYSGGGEGSAKNIVNFIISKKRINIKQTVYL